MIGALTTVFSVWYGAYQAPRKEDRECVAEAIRLQEFLQSDTAQCGAAGGDNLRSYNGRDGRAALVRVMVERRIDVITDRTLRRMGVGDLGTERGRGKLLDDEKWFVWIAVLGSLCFWIFFIIQVTSLRHHVNEYIPIILISLFVTSAIFASIVATTNMLVLVRDIASRLKRRRS